ncbi:MAG: sporulation integral membrane protein YlbJ, partial [Firmicutes bacterium]|nr:sporulation integral membrane protein YlbJ [Bacillota bacterium]
DPLFMIGAVAVGMFHNVALGATIAAAHYISSLMVGLTMRFWGKAEKKEQKRRLKKNIFAHALDELYQARVQDGRPIGKLLGEAVTGSMNTILLVGGFIILFSVLVKVMLITGATKLLTAPIVWLLKPFRTSAAAITPLVSGIFEITLGTYEASIAAVDPKTQLVLASAVIAWSGLSVHGQVAALISKTDMNYLPYFFARILHGFYAGLVTFFIYNPAQEVFKAAPRIWQPFQEFWTINLSLLEARIITALGVIAILAALALLVRLVQRLRVFKLLPPLFHHR